MGYTTCLTGREPLDYLSPRMFVHTAQEVYRL